MAFGNFLQIGCCCGGGGGGGSGCAALGAQYPTLYIHTRYAKDVNCGGDGTTLFPLTFTLSYQTGLSFDYPQGGGGHYSGVGWVSNCQNEPDQYDGSTFLGHVPGCYTQGLGFVWGCSSLWTYGNTDGTCPDFAHGAGGPLFYTNFGSGFGWNSTPDGGFVSFYQGANLGLGSSVNYILTTNPNPVAGPPYR